MFVQVYDKFFPGAVKLRQQFESVFADPYRSHPQRFCWDYWHIPKQYTLLRTPAYHFFSQKEYQAFHRRLVRWGRENLGCHDISPPWLSCYVDGCVQETHQDLPHGPLAFVYSLTPWEKRKFAGGETFLKMRGTKLVAPKFNRLTVFDPATPHGVRKVKGIHTPVEGRLVMHGWFVQPRPFFIGALKPRQVMSVLNAQLGPVLDDCLPRRVKPGFVSCRLYIGSSGGVRKVETLADTNAMGKILQRALKNLHFPKSKGATKLTLPIPFN